MAINGNNLLFLNLKNEQNAVYFAGKKKTKIQQKLYLKFS